VAGGGGIPGGIAGGALTNAQTKPSVSDMRPVPLYCN
jgi:hypothetical protein